MNMMTQVFKSFLNEMENMVWEDFEGYRKDIGAKSKEETLTALRSRMDHMLSHPGSPKN